MCVWRLGLGLLCGCRTDIISSCSIPNTKMELYYRVNIDIEEPISWMQVYDAKAFIKEVPENQPKENHSSKALQSEPCVGCVQQVVDPPSLSYTCHASSRRN